MKIYVVIHENLPELARECGAYEIVSAHTDWEKAREAALNEAESYDYADYKIVDRYDERPKGEKCGYTLYAGGDEDSDCWFNVVVEPIKITE